MDIEARPQVLHRHRATLDVPTGEAAPPRAVPGHLAARLGLLPEREVFRVALLVRRALADALEQAGQLIARQLAVVREAIHLKVDVPTDRVSQALRLQPLDDRQHL